MDSLDTHDTKPVGSSFMPVALALAGILLGTISLYFGVNSKGRDLPSMSSGLDERLENLELRLEAISAENQALKNGMSKVVEQTQTALTQIGREITHIHQQHAESRDAMGKLATVVRPSEKKAGAAAAAARPTSAAPVNQREAISGTPYVIQPGDTLSKLARRHGVPLQAILDANPGINPKVLKVGQTVIIPSSGSA